MESGMMMLTRTLTPELLDGFTRFLREEERSENTIQKYLSAMREFMAWNGDSPVDKTAAVSWKEELLREGIYAPATINAKLAAVNAFFRYAGWEDCRVRALRLQRRMFREPARELTREEYGRLIDAAKAKNDARLALLMETICATGIRVSEVRYITLEAARDGRTVIALKGKIRTILLPSRLCRKLLKYAKKQKIASGEIFLTRGGKSLGRRSIWAAMKSISRAAGVEASKVFPHNLRHLFAMVYYRACRDLVKLADILGHSSIETTRIYLVSTGAEHARQMDMLGLIT